MNKITPLQWDFIYSCRKLGYKVYRSTETGIDFTLRGEDNLHVALKSRKKCTSNGQPQDDWLVLELRDKSGADKSGWLYGPASHLAFELLDRFIVLEREILVQTVTELVNFEKIVGSFDECEYVIYEMHRGDQLTKIEVGRLNNGVIQIPK